MVAGALSMDLESPRPSSGRRRSSSRSSTWYRSPAVSATCYLSPTRRTGLGRTHAGKLRHPRVRRPGRLARAREGARRFHGRRLRPGGGRLRPRKATGASLAPPTTDLGGAVGSDRVTGGVRSGYPVRTTRRWPIAGIDRPGLPGEGRLAMSGRLDDGSGPSRGANRRVRHSTRATSSAKYVRIRSAPARLMDSNDSCATSSRSSHPLSAAAWSIAYSPETLYAATG